MNSTVYWIWLSLCCTPDSATFPKLLSKFSDAKEVFDATDSEISACVGYNSSDRHELLLRDLEKAQEIYEFCTKKGVGILTYNSEKYPSSLRKIKTPPVLLYYRGILPDFENSFFVAIVGTRSLSDYGRRSAFRISYDLATAGAIVVSGMAVGIDGVSLAGAIEAGAPTVAVIGSGIDVCYPPQHVNLARAIVRNGCVLTEYAPGTPPERFNFPKRNRIISGLCPATLVIEGKERSGALITGRTAMEQGRAVYALPGNVGSPNSAVSNLLIKNGAKLCTAADDIVRDFENIYPGKINPFKLSDKFSVDMMSTLSKLSVVAVCPNDTIFDPPRQRRRAKASCMDEHNASDTQTKAHDTVEPPPSFDKDALGIYKKIPLTGSCPIESLVDEQTSLRDVMRLLLKLEMNKFIVMLPGECVGRKPK